MSVRASRSSALNETADRATRCSVGLVIKGLRVKLPLPISRPLISLLCFLRLRDPPKRPATPITQPVESTPPSPPVDPSPRPSLRSRSESKIGTPATEESAMAGMEEPAVEVEEERLTLVVDLHWAPVAGVVLLLITKTINGSVLRLGIVGEDGICPYDVLVLFIALVSLHVRFAVAPTELFFFLSLGLYFDGVRFHGSSSGTLILHHPASGAKTSLESAVGGEDRERAVPLFDPVLVLVCGRSGSRQ